MLLGRTAAKLVGKVHCPSALTSSHSVMIIMSCSSSLLSVSYSSIVVLFGCCTVFLLFVALLMIKSQVQHLSFDD